MIIGVPNEIKIGENRVGVTPAGVNTLVESGHKVLVEKGAGKGSGFRDNEYMNAGGILSSSATEVWDAELILKVKEPVGQELRMFRESLLLFAYLHLAHPDFGDLTRKLIDDKVTAIGYETVQLPSGRLPLLEPMSEVAGKMAIQIAAHFLEKTNGGSGVLLGGVPGVRPANVVIIGAGTVGWNAAQVALGTGANVTVINRNVEALRQLVRSVGTAHPGNLTTLKLNSYNISEALKDADVVIGAVLKVGARAPKLVSLETVRTMRAGSVIIDVDIDQGGIFEKSRSTTHENPIYEDDGIIYYCVPNMPGAVPRTSTFALSNVTLPYALELANMGFLKAVKKDVALAKGVNIYAGYVTNKGVAAAHGLGYKPLEDIL